MRRVVKYHITYNSPFFLHVLILYLKNDNLWLGFSDLIRLLRECRERKNDTILCRRKVWGIVIASFALGQTPKNFLCKSFIRGVNIFWFLGLNKYFWKKNECHYLLCFYNLSKNTRIKFSSSNFFSYCNKILHIKQDKKLFIQKNGAIRLDKIFS